MRQEEFLSLHQISGNPFVSAEEAQGDEVLMRILEQNDHNFGHPGWAKFCGDPPGNQTSLVFGPKGSGKTAMRLALEKRIRVHNENSPDKKVLLVRYADFNRYLDNWHSRIAHRNEKRRSWWARFSRNKPPLPALKQDWTLSHHVDAMLSEMAQLMPDILQGSIAKPCKWPDLIKGDALFLVATFLPQELARYRNTLRDIYRRLYSAPARFCRTLGKWIAGIITLGIFPMWTLLQSRRLAARADQRIDVVGRDIKDTAWAFRRISGSHLRCAPLMGKNDDPASQDARYELLGRMRAIVTAAGYARTVVVVDKVDEPVLIHGDEKMMVDFIRPLLNNKLLQFEGLHFKMLLPYQLNVLRRRADSETANEARLDKANVIDPFLWSGMDLHQMLTERISACSTDGTDPIDLQSLFAPSISRSEVVAELEKLKTPRNANKFMDRLIRGACSMDSSSQEGSMPQIPSKVFHRVSAEMDTEMRHSAQDLGEIF